MKTRYILSMFVISFLLLACNNEDIVREASPATNPNSMNTYFSSRNNSNPILTITQDTFSIIVARKIFDKSGTVALTIGNSYGDTIQIPAEAKFNAGDSLTRVKITTKKLILMKKYHVAVTIDQAQTLPYKTQSIYPRIELNILKEDYAPYAEGKFTSDFFEDTWDQTLEYSPSTKNYRFKGLYTPGYDYLFKVADTGAITQVPNSAVATGYVHSKYGMVSVLANSTSKFDNTTSTYTFNSKFTVSAGSFGTFPEKYLISTKH